MDMKTQFQQVMDGELEPSTLYAELLSQQEEINGKIEILKPLVLDELQKYPEKEVKLHGLTFQKKSAPGKWNFENIPQWNELKVKIKSLEDMAKNCWKQREKGIVVHMADADGVEISIPTYTEGKDTFAVISR